jgi:hypothetical protein
LVAFKLAGLGLHKDGVGIIEQCQGFGDSCVGDSLGFGQIAVKVVLHMIPGFPVHGHSFSRSDGWLLLHWQALALPQPVSTETCNIRQAEAAAKGKATDCTKSTLGTDVFRHNGAILAQSSE